MEPQPVHIRSALFVMASFALLSACGGGRLKPALTQIQITPGSAVVGKGKTMQLKATGVYSDATTEDLTALAVWGTSQAKIAAVSAGGVLSGTTAGNATITAAYLGVLGTDSVTVQPATLTSIQVAPPNPAIGKSMTLQLTAMGTFSDGTQLDITSSATWGTSQAGIAAVSAGGMVTGTAAGNATITAAYNGATGTDSITVQPATLSSIQILPNTPAIGKSKTLQLTATGIFSDGTQQNLTATATWQTNPASVATVSPAGLVTGMTAGNAEVSARVQGVTGTDTITIQPATLTSIAVGPSNPSLRKAKTLQMSATGSYSDGTTQDLTASASWTTNQPTIAGVSSSGMLTGITPGDAVISAVYQGITGTDAVTIQPPLLLSIAISPTNLSLGKSDSFQMTATGSFGDGTQRDITARVGWATTQPSIAYVQNGGLLTALSAGAAQISATYQGVTGNDNVTVLQPVLTSLTVSPKKSLILIGENKQLSAIAAYSDGSTQDVTRSATWGSMASGTVSVNATGIVLGNTAGATVIKAQYGSMTGNAKVAVTSATATAVTVKPDKATLPLGGGKGLKAIATLSDGTKLDITQWATWTSAHPDIVEVSRSGTAIAARVGSTDVTAAASGVSGSAQISVLPASIVNYFDLTAAQVTGSANTVRISNPGLTGGDLCSMIYVFDAKQELTECCGCKVTDSGLRTLSLTKDLTNNPLTGTVPPTGSVEIVPSDPANNPTCDPRSLKPAGLLAGWGTNGQMNSDGTAQVTETQFSRSTLNGAGISSLATMCTALQQLGSGAGVCTCGTGD